MKGISCGNGPKLFDTDSVHERNFLKKVNFEKKLADDN